MQKLAEGELAGSVLQSLVGKICLVKVSCSTWTTGEAARLCECFRSPAAGLCPFHGNEPGSTCLPWPRTVRNGLLEGFVFCISSQKNLRWGRSARGAACLFLPHLVAKLVSDKLFQELEMCSGQNIPQPLPVW